MTRHTDHSEPNDCDSSDGLNCQQLDSFLVDYVDNKLSAKQRLAFEEHISFCAACVSYVEDYKSAIKLGKEAFQKETQECDERIPNELVSAIIKASKS